ncbi:MAG: Ig domain-containing protein, partial [Planctomycetaceae bacterium]
MNRMLKSVCMAILSCFANGASASEQPLPFVVTPAEAKLSGNLSRAQLVVMRSDAGGQIGERSEDLTHGAAFQSSDANVVAVDSRGQLLAKGNGSAKVRVKVGDVSKEIAVTVEKVEPVTKVGYVEDVSPILNKAGCSMGACHAAQYGQGGFKLSVFGSELDQDREAIVRDRAQRRLSFVEPTESLFLKKPTMQVPHGGGKRLAAGSVDYEILKAWIANGAPKPDAKAPEVAKISVFPSKRLGGIGLKQQLRVEATYSDGSTRDVTSWAKYDSMDDGMLAVNGDGRVTVTGQGQAPVMVRFEGQAEISLFV